MPKRILILLLTVLVISLPRAVAGSMDTLHTTYVVNSDYVPTHVVTITAGGGLHTLMPKMSEAGAGTFGLDKALGAGAQVQALYSYYFHKYVGITAGVGFDMYTGNMHGSFTVRDSLIDRTNTYMNQPNGKNLPYVLNSEFINFKEREQLYLVTIPVGITGRVNVTDHIQLRGTLGAGMNIVVGSHYRGEGQLRTTADYEDYKLHFDSDLPQHGFSNYYMGGYQGKIENTFPVSMFVFGDFGMHYQFNKRIGLYAGVYVTYTCFSSIRPQTTLTGNRYELVKFDQQTKQFSYNGMFNSKYIDAINPLSAGVKIGVTITFLDPIKCNCEDW